MKADELMLASVADFSTKQDELIKFKVAELKKCEKVTKIASLEFEDAFNLCHNEK